MNLGSFDYRPLLLVGTVCLVATAACSGDDAIENAGAQASPTAQSPQADTLLREMSSRLAHAREFTFDAHRVMDTALLGGRNVPEDAQVKVSVKRPNKVRGVSRTKETTRDFYFDGQTVTVYDRTKKMYATAKMPGTIDQMVERLDREFGFPPPLGEFVVADMYRTVLRELRSRSLGPMKTINGTSCRTVNWSGELADGEVWVDTQNDVPCGFVAGFRKIKGKPEVRVGFSNWNLDASLPDTMFTFRPPAGARQIRMETRAEIVRDVRAEQMTAQRQPAQRQPAQRKR